MPIVYTERHQRHATASVRVHGEAYPEVPARAETLLAAALAAGLGPVQAPEDYGLAPILAVHTPALIEFLQNIHAASLNVRHTTVGAGSAAPLFMADTFATRSARRRSPHPWAQIGYHSFDIEAPFLEGTWEAAYWSAQCALTAAEQVRAGAPAVYALCRPPGHHATADQTGGFCYLNNAAVAARHLQRTAGARIAVLDIDYHHGNGTQEIFYDDPTVFYASLHAHPDEDYPFFWGAEDERGAGPGLGTNLNLPLPRGTDDAGYLAGLDQALAAVRAFAPEYLVLSLGMDIAAGDPASLTSGFAVSPAGFRAIGERVAAAGFPTVIIQEGGYRLATLAENGRAVLSAFAAPRAE